MDVFIAGVFLIAVVVWSSSQELLTAVSSAPNEPSATVEASPAPENAALECERGRPLIIARDLTVQTSNEDSGHGP